MLIKPLFFFLNNDYCLVINVKVVNIPFFILFSLRLHGLRPNILQPIGLGIELQKNVVVYIFQSGGHQLQPKQSWHALAFRALYIPDKQGSKLTLVRWPMASGFAVRPVKSAIHWPGWPVKF